MLLVGYAAAIVYPTLPSIDALTEYNPKIPLRIYSAEGTLIGEFGEERRAMVRIADVPSALKQAILAAEDERFYEHGGVDYIGVLRAVLHNFSAGGARQGASTITMQVARNFFLTKEKTFHSQVQRGAARLQDRAQPDQGPDPRDLHQPDLPRSARIWLRVRRPSLFRKKSAGLESG